jgi:hypothetical protein
MVRQDRSLIYIISGTQDSGSWEPYRSVHHQPRLSAGVASDHDHSQPAAAPVLASIALTRSHPDDSSHSTFDLPGDQFSLLVNHLIYQSSLPSVPFLRKRTPGPWSDIVDKVDLPCRYIGSSSFCMHSSRQPPYVSRIISMIRHLGLCDTVK